MDNETIAKVAGIGGTVLAALFTAIGGLWASRYKRDSAVAKVEIDAETAHRAELQESVQYWRGETERLWTAYMRSQNNVLSWTWATNRARAQRDDLWRQLDTLCQQQSFPRPPALPPDETPANWEAVPAPGTTPPANGGAR